MYATALSLLAIGMITIFSILGLVVLSGQALIRLVNRFAPDAPDRVSAKAISSPADISDAHVAAIVAAVATHTQGRGQVTRIQKKS